jgi:sugar/nucleoside kinase (ribokinase family)
MPPENPMPNDSRYDVYAFGVISSSTLHLLRHSFPQPDGYAEITQSLPMTGGEALNSAIVLSRLGLTVQLDGNWLGDTAESRRLLDTIQQYGIDTRRLIMKKRYSGVREIVFSDAQSRTIFGNYVDLLTTTRKWNVPRKADVGNARIVCVDPPFREESASAGRYAKELGIPFVSIDCPCDNELATAAEAVIVSGEFRAREYPGAAPAELFAQYQSRARGLVVFTNGDEPVVYGRHGQDRRQFTPCRVDVVDTAGAGDSFRAGVVYGLLQGWQDPQIVEYASALAGLVCTRFPGVLDSPSHLEVSRFIRRRSATGD